MDFLELVKKRQSTRKYLDRSVQEELVKKCLEAARLAPSACNAQPWYFIVVDQIAIKSDFLSKVFSGPYAMNNFVKNAPVFIVAVAKRTTYAASLAGLFRGINYSLIDIGIACEHLVLEATELGLGTCWLGWFNEKQVKKILKIPRQDKIAVIISLGYPETEETRDKMRKSLAEISDFKR
jgi:nitroreductase